MKGFGTDKYIWDPHVTDEITGQVSGTNSLFIIGKNSGYITAEVNTIATERLGYNWKSEGINLLTDYEDGRVGENRYKLNLPVTSNNQIGKTTYTLDMSTVLSGQEDLILESETFNVYHIPKWTSLVSLISDGEEPLKIEQKPLAGTTSILTEIISNPKIQAELSNGMNLNGNLSKPNTTVTLVSGVDTVEVTKEFVNGTYTEIIRGERVTINTNINSGITESEGDWKLSGTVITEDKTYSIPTEISDMITDGWQIDMVVAPNYTPVETDGYKKWQELASNGTVYSGADIADFTTTAPSTQQISFRVTKLIPTYKFQVLSLQPVGFGKGAGTLEAYGNANIQYDENLIFNRITNKVVEHNKLVYTNGKWISEMYYRVDDGDKQLVLITRDGLSLYNTNTLIHLEDKTFPNIGSFVFNNKLFIGSQNGLHTYTVGQNPIQTSYTDKVNYVVTNGENIFIANDEGLVILDSSLNTIQTLTNSEIGLTRIRSLHASEGIIYAGADEEGNEFIPISK